MGGKVTGAERGGEGVGGTRRDTPPRSAARVNGDGTSTQETVITIVSAFPSTRKESFYCLCGGVQSNVIF